MKKELEELLSQHEEFLVENVLNKNKLSELARKCDAKLLNMLMSEDTWRLIVSWACTFSSFLACKTVGYAVGASGMLGGVVLGGLSISAGYIVTKACSFVFNTLVNRVGGKNAACGVISSGKATWDYFH